MPPTQIHTHTHSHTAHLTLRIHRQFESNINSRKLKPRSRLSHILRHYVNLYTHTYTERQADTQTHTRTHTHTHSYTHTHTWQSNDYENGSDRALLKPEAASRRTSRQQKRMRLRFVVWVRVRLRVLESIHLAAKRGEAAEFSSVTVEGISSAQFTNSQAPNEDAGNANAYANPVLSCPARPGSAPCLRQEGATGLGLPAAAWRGISLQQPRIIQIAYKFSVVVTFGW